MSKETVVTHVPPSAKPASRSSRTSVPSQLGRYTIKRMLGRGGMGAVYEAEDPELARNVAIKMLRDDREGDTEALRHEAQALAKLVHPNVVTVHDVGVHDGEVYLVMQLVSGQTIDRWLATHRASADRIVELYRKAGEGLAAAHAAGLVHCDFKPGNILVDDHAHVRVTDFGLARMARAEPGPATSLHIAGTPAYMAPEQFAGIATPQSDQFAFCVALWEALAGERPFDDVPIDTGNVERPPPRGRIPARFARVLERGMLDDPNARYPSMTELLADLKPRNPRLRIAIVAVPVIVAAGVGAFVLLRDKSIARVRDVSHLTAPTPLTTFGRVACAYAPAIEPGAKHVVFDRTEGEAVDLYTIPLAGNASPRQLTSSPRWEWRAAPGRKPNEVVHLIHDAKESGKDPKVAYLDVNTGKETIVLERIVWDAVVAGDTLYFTPDLPHGIRRRSLDGARESELVKPPAGLRFILLAAAPKGKRIASVGSSADDGPVKPCVIELTTRDVICSPTNATPTRPAFGADGSTLYFAVDDEIRAFDIAKRTETVVFKSASDYPEGGLAIAPDGSALVFSTCYAHSAVVDAQTQAPIIDDENATQPTVAANGAIAWVRITYRNRELVVRTPDGRRTQVTNIANESIHTPSFDAKGTAIVFTASAPNPGIFVARLAQAGAIQQLTENQLDQAPLWLADGRVAFTRTDANGTDHIFTISSDGGTPTPITSSSRKAFAARGNDLLVYSVASGHLYWVDVTTKEERPGPQQPEGELQSVAISPSGQWIVYQLGANGQTIYRARLDPPTPPEHVHEYAAGQTVSPPTIDDTGRVLATPATWYGDLFVLRPKPGHRF